MTEYFFFGLFIGIGLFLLGLMVGFGLEALGKQLGEGLIEAERIRAAAHDAGTQNQIPNEGA